MVEPKSWLMWARMNDLELIREIDSASGYDEETSSSATAGRGFETFQFGATEQLLAAILKVMASDEKASMIQPRTAWDDLHEEKSHAQLQMTRMTVTRVSAEEYARLMEGSTAVAAEVFDDDK